MSIGKYRTYLMREQGKVVSQFYVRSLRYALLDVLLNLRYFWENPYRMSRKFLERKGEENVYTYGETPLTSWAQIISWAEVNSSDCLVDLGCGRGRLCFWTNHFVRCAVIGVDHFDFFIRWAECIARMFHRNNVQFQCANIAAVSLKRATVVYLYTYHPDEEKICWDELAVGSRVITVSEPLAHQDFITYKSRPFSFPWGMADVYCCIKKR